MEKAQEERGKEEEGRVEDGGGPLHREEGGSSAPLDCNSVTRSVCSLAREIRLIHAGAADRFSFSLPSPRSCPKSFFDVGFEWYVSVKCIPPGLLSYILEQISCSRRVFFPLSQFS
jgi:hypothetical protein